MAIVTNDISPMMGSVGAVTYYKVGNKVIAKQKNSRQASPTRSPMLMRQRTMVSNVVSVWNTLKEELRDCFEGNPQSAYNRFRALAYRGVAVYLPKQLAKVGCSVVAPYQISEGSLRSIAVTDCNGTMKTDIDLGNLVIDETTTVSDLTEAILRHNSDFHAGDTLTYLLLTQTLDHLNHPRTTPKWAVVRLDSRDDSLVWKRFGTQGFATVGGSLGAAHPIEGGQAWIHRRRTRDGILSSSQHLEVSNALFEQYGSSEALKAAAKSYGCPMRCNSLDRHYTENDFQATPLNAQTPHLHCHHAITEPQTESHLATEKVLTKNHIAPADCTATQSPATVAPQTDSTTANARLQQIANLVAEMQLAVEALVAASQTETPTVDHTQAEAVQTALTTMIEAITPLAATEPQPSAPQQATPSAQTPTPTSDKENTPKDNRPTTDNHTPNTTTSTTAQPPTLTTTTPPTTPPTLTHLLHQMQSLQQKLSNALAPNTFTKEHK